MSELKGRGTAWTEERGTSDEGRRRLKAPRRRAEGRAARRRAESTVSAALWRRPWARAIILLTPPLAWFVLLYLAALVVLLITAFWQINPFTTNIERVWSLGNFTTIFSSAAYRGIILRTVGMAAAVTVVDAAVAFPFAYFMARVASPRTRTALFVAILLPLWASYLAKVYSWLLIFTHDGILDWGLGRAGLGQTHLIYTNWAVFTVFCYLWLPFMIIPVYAALERIPASQIEASQDLGARTWRTTRLVLLPLALPGIVAGSIFTFSLTLGDYITPLLVGGTSANFMGNIIYSNIGIANNVPFAAAMALIPIVIMAVYLLSARALGAFEAI
jgi:putative spermidine/putrescine transport system permease protein